MFLNRTCSSYGILGKSQWGRECLNLQHSNTCVQIHPQKGLPKFWKKNHVILQTKGNQNRIPKIHTKPWKLFRLKFHFTVWNIQVASSWIKMGDVNPFLYWSSLELKQFFNCSKNLYTYGMFIMLLLLALREGFVKDCKDFYKGIVLGNILTPTLPPRI